MTEHVDGWIPDLLFGTLDDATRAMVELHLSRCERCASEMVSLTGTLSDVALSIPPERPSRTSARSRGFRADSGAPELPAA